MDFLPRSQRLEAQHAHLTVLTSRSQRLEAHCAHCLDTNGLFDI